MGIPVSIRELGVDYGYTRLKEEEIYLEGKGSPDREKAGSNLLVTI